MGEADSQDRPFKPKVLAFKLLQSKLISENGFYFLFTSMDRATDRLSLLHTDAYRGTLRVHFGNRYASIVW
jgi:hypothetical protein